MLARKGSKCVTVVDVQVFALSCRSSFRELFWGRLGAVLAAKLASKSGPRRVQDEVKMLAKFWSLLGTDLGRFSAPSWAPKRPPNRPKSLQDRPENFQDHPRSSKIPPNRPGILPGPPRDPPRTPPGTPRGLSRTPPGTPPDPQMKDFEADFGPPLHRNPLPSETPKTPAKQLHIPGPAECAKRLNPPPPWFTTGVRRVWMQGGRSAPAPGVSDQALDTGLCMLPLL